MNYVLLFGMPGGAELFFIVLIIIMLFGSKKIPELARGLGKGIREIKNATGDIQREIKEGTRDISELKDKVNVEKQVKDLISGDREQKEQAKVKVAEPKVAKKEESKEEVNKEGDVSMAFTKTVKRKSPYDKEEPKNTSEEN